MLPANLGSLWVTGHFKTKDPMSRSHPKILYAFFIKEAQERGSSRMTGAKLHEKCRPHPAMGLISQAAALYGYVPDMPALHHALPDTGIFNGFCDSMGTGQITCSQASRHAGIGDRLVLCLRQQLKYEALSGEYHGAYGLNSAFPLPVPEVSGFCHPVPEYPGQKKKGGCCNAR